MQLLELRYGFGIQKIWWIKDTFISCHANGLSYEARYIETKQG